MTTTPSAPPSTTQPAPTPRHRIELSATQVLASALAAVLATVAASYLGVAGTLVGAAVAAAITVVGNAIVGHGLHRTRERIPAPWIRPIPATSTTPPVLPTRAPQPGSAPLYRRLGFATVSVFALILFVLTAFELVTGRPISDLLRGDSGTGTTLFGADAGTTTQLDAPVQTQTVTVTQSVVVTTPTVTKTASAVTETTTPTVTETPSSSAPATSESSSPSTTTTP